MTSWLMSEGKLSRGPYSICPGVRGFSLWFRHEGHFGILKSQILTLDGAKKLADEHEAKEKYQAKQLEAVFTK